MNIDKDIGKRIKEVRKKANDTQEEFAQALGLKRNTIASYEIGATSPSNLVINAICEKYGVNKDWLCGGHGDPYINRSANEDIVDFMTNLVNSEPKFKHRLIAVLARMNGDEWELLEKKMCELFSEEDE